MIFFAYKEKFDIYEGQEHKRTNNLEKHEDTGF